MARRWRDMVEWNEVTEGGRSGFAGLMLSYRFGDAYQTPEEEIGAIE